MDPATFSILTAQRILEIRIAHVDDSNQCNITMQRTTIDDIEAAASEARRGACARAASSRATDNCSDDEDLLSDDEQDSAHGTYTTLRVRTLPVAELGEVVVAVPLGVGVH